MNRMINPPNTGDKMSIQGFFSIDIGDRGSGIGISANYLSAIDDTFGAGNIGAR